MFRHCVMFRWKPGTGDNVKAAIAAGLNELAHLEGVLSYTHGADLGLRDDNWDYVVVGDFVDEAAYRGYATDPGHVELIQTLIVPNIEERAGAQYVVG